MSEKNPRDPRRWQILALGSLLTYGVLFLRLDLRLDVCLAILVTAQLAQAAASRAVAIPFEAKSALISSLSLCLLLRTDAWATAALVAAVAILSKFTLRARGKHVFNPTNFALVVAVLAFDGVWVSPGQWGAVAFFGFLIASVGVFVVHRSRRGDVTWAFLAAWASLLVGRALWLGDPLAIPLHQLQSGALLIFAFFMISDPKTTPDRRLGRVLWAALVAALAATLQFALYRPNALLFALVLSAPAVPLIDRFLPAERFAWRPRPEPPSTSTPSTSTPSFTSTNLTPTRSYTMSENPSFTRRLPASRTAAPRATLLALALMLPALLLGGTSPAAAFCGFYVAKADTGLYNRASQVVIVRDGERTVLTMANDYEGDPSEFAVVIPVPTALGRGQIHVGEQAVIDHLDAYTAPRLVEYHDPDPCRVAYRDRVLESAAVQDVMAEESERRARSLGVTIEASYTVGEYDIKILSADESRGLATWLREQDYRLPDGAEAVLGSYLKQGLRFVVAKVNLEAKARLGTARLRPLQMAFETPRFMLPIRLGTLNADGAQELFVWILTRTGRVETTNYRTVKLPSDVEIPAYVEDGFGDFYRDLFAHQVEQERRRAVFLEYAWDMAWCDPCAADPLSNAQLRQLGVFWLGEDEARGRRAQGQDVFVTRLHVSYTADSFPEDLVFQETGDRGNFQGRYVIRRPWSGDRNACPAAARYLDELRERREQRARQLARLTGWPLAEIRAEMELTGGPAEAGDGGDASWWRRLWR